MNPRISPVPDGERLIHNRSYDIDSYRIDSNTLRLRGRVTDTKPPGLFVADDPEPLDVHDMTVDLIISFPSFEISAANVVFDTHPHDNCPSIEVAYDQLVGLSIARGFSRRVTELFGGPSGCTHVGALLRAMAPVAIQASYSMPRAEPDYDHRSHQERSPEQIERDAQFVINSCHVWEETGSFAKRASVGRRLDGAPVWIRDRLAKLGRSSEDSNW